MWFLMSFWHLVRRIAHIVAFIDEILVEVVGAPLLLFQPRLILLHLR